MKVEELSLLSSVNVDPNYRHTFEDDVDYMQKFILGDIIRVQGKISEFNPETDYPRFFITDCDAILEPADPEYKLANGDNGIYPSINNNTLSGHIDSVIHSNNLSVGVGLYRTNEDGTVINQLWYSTDNLTWIRGYYTTDNAGRSYNKILFFNGYYWVTGGTYLSYTSTPQGNNMSLMTTIQLPQYMTIYNNRLYVITSTGVIYSISSPATYEIVSTLTQSEGNASIGSLGGILFASLENGRIYKSTNGTSFTLFQTFTNTEQVLNKFIEVNSSLYFSLSGSNVTNNKTWKYNTDTDVFDLTNGDPLFDIAYNNGLYAATPFINYSSLATSIFYSSDGLVFSHFIVDNTASYELYAITSLDNKFYTFGNNSKWYSFIYALVGEDINAMEAIPNYYNYQNSGQYIFDVDYSGYATIGMKKIYAYDPTNMLVIFESYFEVMSPDDPRSADTICINYTNKRNDFDAIFFDNTGEQLHFEFRIEGALVRYNELYNNETQYFRNQNYTPNVLSSYPYTGKTLKIGDSDGVPAWVGEKLNIILSCTNITIETNAFKNSYVRHESSNVEIIVIDEKYPKYVYQAAIEQTNSRYGIPPYSYYQALDNNPAPPSWIYTGSTYINISSENVISLNYEILKDSLIDDGFLNEGSDAFFSNFVKIDQLETELNNYVAKDELNGMLGDYAKVNDNRTWNNTGILNLGTLNTSGSAYSVGNVFSGGKKSYNDGIVGIGLLNDGNLVMQGATQPRIGFYRGNNTSSSSSIDAGTSNGILNFNASQGNNFSGIINANNGINYTSISIPSNSNLNNYLTGGFFTVETNAIAATVSNVPIQQAGVLHVMQQSTTIRTVQSYYVYDNSGTNTGMFQRCQTSSGTWVAWRRVAYADEIPTQATTNYQAVIYLNSIGSVTTYFNNTGLTFSTSYNSSDDTFILTHQLGNSNYAIFIQTYGGGYAYPTASNNNSVLITGSGGANIFVNFILPYTNRL